MSTNTDQEKRNAINTAAINFYKSVKNNTINKVTDIFQKVTRPSLSVNVTPLSVAVMQGQSATATVSAVGNKYVSGLSYGLSGAPTWITISDDLILIQPSDNDLGFANVQVYAQDTGSDAMSAAILRAEAKLRPIIESLSVIPPAVTVQQGQLAIASISAVANEAVTGLYYSLNGASSWVNLKGDSIIAAPTDNDLGTNVLDVIAYDTNSSASAATQFTATAALRPIIQSVSVNPPTVAAVQGESTTATISAVANEAVTGLSYSLEGNPDWMNLSGSVILMTPTENDSESAAVTVTAFDLSSSASAATVFNAEAKSRPEIVSFTTYPNISTVQVTNNTTTFVTLQATGNEAVESINYTAVGDNVDEWITISGNKASLKSPYSAGTPLQGSIIASDSTGVARKTIDISGYTYRYPTMTFNPPEITLTSGSSGSVTVNINYTSDSSGNIKISNFKPRDAKITAQETLYSSAGSIQGAMKIIYPKKSQSSLDHTTSNSMFITQYSKGYYSSRVYWFELIGGTRVGMGTNTITPTRITKS